MGIELLVSFDLLTILEIETDFLPIQPYLFYTFTSTVYTRVRFNENRNSNTGFI